LWRLIARDRDGREVARVHVAPPSGEIVIGRDPDAHVQLPSVGVSRRHARIAAQGEKLLIFDEGSANGVVVEGRRIARSAELKPGALVQIAEFLIEIDVAAAEGGGKPAAQPETWRLLCTGGRLDGRVFQLNKAGVVVGRGPGVDVVIDDPSISRRHARFAPVDGALQVEDLGSQNGTFVGGAQVERARVEEGQQLRLGDLSFAVERGAGSSTAFVGPAALRRGLFWAGIAAAVAGSLLLVLAMVRKPVQEPPTSLDRLSSEVEEHVEKARLAISRRHFSDAMGELGQALTRDPLNTEARNLERRVAQEQKTEKLMLQAAEALARGGAEDLAHARSIYLQIPDGSAFHGEAETKRADIEKRLPAQLVHEAERTCTSGEPTERCRSIVCAAAGLRDPAAVRLRRRYANVTCP
jgi:pSer/pThr/pTyr-binding forkhead associated (FHA) protein